MSKFRTLAETLGLVVRSEPTSPPAGVLPPPRSSAGSGASLSEALTIDSVFRSFMFLQAAAQQLTLDVWRRSDLIEKPPLVRKPDVDSNLSAFLAETVTSLTARGNAYWRKNLGSDGQVLNLEILPALEVHIDRDPRSGRRGFYYRGRRFASHEIAHLKLLRITGEEYGLGPIQAFQRGLAGALDQARYAQGWFNDAGVPSGVLKTDQHINAAQAEEYKTRWMEQRSKDLGPAVLGSGLEYSFLQLKPSEVQWLDTQKFTVTQIARLFGIPASYMLAAVEGNSQTYQNQEQADIAFIRYTLMVYLREIEEAFTDLLPHGQTARFNVDALLRTDTKTRMESHKIGIEAGVLTINEARAIEGLPPLESVTTEENLNV